ncbi:hypothetical protein [Brevibacillus migulae]|uniref:hypothetical protein n=1 Tax=Brevibacillus migulae TaxID=1644114 RepID=UPI001F46E8A9|nr:hypothetical protein [Brevibacillus migulae]
MSHQVDHQADPQRTIEPTVLLETLKASLSMENELMRTYLITADRIHDNEDLKVRLQNFAEGNAKRTQQLLDEIKRMQ